MQAEFKEYMMMIGNSLQTGYALERALRVAEDELSKLFGRESVLVPYIKEMNSKIAVNVQVEQAFKEFAEQTDLEEAVNLAEILSFSKRSGGDYGKHIKNAAMKIEDKLDIQEEIATLISAKRLELKVMCVMPLFILGYISLTSQEFIAPLYGSLIGVSVMTVSLLLYGLMIIIGRKIITINV